tara:strand:- start:689 stop:979 length:291 start_codon:yes stop_codon:yes gene_type:complete
LNLTSKQRKFLKSKAHHLKPTVLVGKNDINKGVINSIDESLNTNELIKVKFHEGKMTEDRKKTIAESLECEIAGCIGKTMILFRQNKDKDKQKIKF